MPSSAEAVVAKGAGRSAAEGPGTGERAAEGAPGGEGKGAGWRGYGMGALSDHIIATHHAFQREQLPRVSEMLERTMARDDNRFAELWSLREVLGVLRASMESCTRKEEQVLYPLIHQLDRARRLGDRPPERVAGYLRDLSHDHRTAALTLRNLDEATQHYTVPEEASGAFRELIRELARLSEDLRVHNQKEHALIERAIAAERELLGEKTDEENSWAETDHA